MNSRTLEATLMLISLAVAPVLIFLHAVYIADRYEKEPIKNLFRYLLAGGVATAGVLLLDPLLPFPHPPRDVNWIPLFSAFFVAINGGESGAGLIVGVVFVEYFFTLPRVQIQQQVARSGLRLPPIILPDKFLSLRIARD